MLNEEVRRIQELALELDASTLEREPVEGAGVVIALGAAVERLLTALDARLSGPDN
jgi:hypothetical protein